MDEGSSFAKEFGIKTITLLAGVPSSPVPWSDADQFGDFLELVASCYTGPGAFVLPPECVGFDDNADIDVDWEDIRVLDPGTIFDCDPNTVPIGIPDAPPPGDCEMNSTLGDRDPGPSNNPKPLQIVRAVFDAAPQQRPFTSSGIFGAEDGATLNVIAFELDATVGPRLYI